MNFLDLLLKLSPALESGKSLANANGWSNVALANHAIVAVLGFILLAVKMGGYEIPITDAQITTLAGNSTISIYAKAGTQTLLGIHENYIYNQIGYFDLINGIAYKTNASPYVSVAIVSAGNGWWRCSATRTDTDTHNWLPWFYGGNGSFGNNWALGTNLYIWGTQLVPFVFNTDYQSTTSSALIGWSKSTVTTAKNQTGIDGVANACTSIVAASSNSILIQPVIATSANKTSSVYLKRMTGTGIIQVTMDGGNTWITVDLSNGIWNRIVLIATIANPTVGVKIVTSGDAVAMDYGQIELNTDCNCATTPILTTTASVTRAADFGTTPILKLPNYFNFGKGTLYGEGVVLAVTKAHIKSLLSYGAGGSNSSDIGFNYDARTYAAQESTLVISIAVGTSYPPAFTSAKIAMSYKQGEFNFADSLNSFNTQTILSSMKLTTISFTIGSSSNGVNYQGYIKRVVYYPFDMNINKIKDIVSQ